MLKGKFLLLLIAIVFVFSCSVRDTATPEKALIGHWLTENGKTHYYFNAAGKAVMVDDGRRMDQSYIVLESNNNENWILIRVTTGYGIGHDKKLSFGYDRKSLTCAAKIDNTTINTKWNYVNSNKEP
jgi:hypothetical protein